MLPLKVLVKGPESCFNVLVQDLLLLTNLVPDGDEKGLAFGFAHVEVPGDCPGLAGLHKGNFLDKGVGILLEGPAFLRVLIEFLFDIVLIAVSDGRGVGGLMASFVLGEEVLKTHFPFLHPL